MMMHEMLTASGLLNKTVDIMKLDCEGCEYSTYNIPPASQTPYKLLEKVCKSSDKVVIRDSNHGVRDKRALLSLRRP